LTRRWPRPTRSKPPRPPPPTPPHVKASRPNLSRSKTLQVRLNPDEYAAIERIAEERGLPVSTIARAQLLALLDTPTADDPLQKLMQAAREFAIGA
jgi:uncharacterized protein (DUF1778 family)